LLGDEESGKNTSLGGRSGGRWGLAGLSPARYMALDDDEIFAFLELTGTVGTEKQSLNDEAR
jgi:hypothetical protein